mgnify:FL=1
MKQLQQETGASIQVENVSPESDERVIRVSSFEVSRYILLLIIVAYWGDC